MKDARIRLESQTLPPIVRGFLKETDIYLLGPMGVGKTAFADNLRRLAGVNYISIGDITRRALMAQAVDPVYVKREKGRIPLAAVQMIVSPYLNPNSSYILDGVPRWPDEAEWIKAHILERPFTAIALTLSASDKIILGRIQQRSLASDRPETPERIARRLEVYRNNCKTVLGILEPVFYKSIELDTSHLSPGEVLEAFCTVITKEFSNGERLSQNNG